MNLLDSVKGPLADFVRSLFPRYGFLGIRGAKVVAQNADQTLEVVPDDEALPRGISSVRIRHGLPGLEVKVPAGTRCLLGFEGGNPDAPYVAGWEPGTPLELVVTAATKVTVNAPQVLLGDGHAAVVRYGDAVTLAPVGATPLAAAGGLAVAGIATIAPGLPQTANPLPTKVMA